MTKKRCTKRKFATRAEAEAAIRGLVRRFPSIVFKKSYWCGKCRAWHITGSPPPSARRRRVKY